MSKIIVTGSEGLLGKEITKHLKFIGHDVQCFSRSLGHDLTDESSVKSIFQDYNADYLVNLFALNDSVVVDRSYDTMFDISLESVSRYLGVNLVSLFSVCREFAKNNMTGGIVNFSSIYGMKSPDPEMYNGHKHVGYCISKAGVINLTKYLAVHLAPNFNVNCISPGGVIYDQPDDFVDMYSKKTLIGRMLFPYELNDLVSFLCSDKSSCVTGQNFVVDGGYTL